MVFFIIFIIFSLFLIVCAIFAPKTFVFKNNKVFNKNNVPIYRNIPDNKDIFYAHVLIKLNDLGVSKNNIFGAIILKWLKDDKIVLKTENRMFFKKKKISIIMKENISFDYEAESQLYEIMREASNDNVLETNELVGWCNKNSDKFLKVINRFCNDTYRLLEYDGHIEKNEVDSLNGVNKYGYQKKLSDQIYNDSIQLCGLKKYLEEFSRMHTKEIMEVKLWDEYLIYAELFGIAGKVSKQLKKLYPEIGEAMNNISYDIDTLDFVGHISTKSISRAYAESSTYSSGGGGSSSSGGGGGSFGGGGGGSR